MEILRSEWRAERWEVDKALAEDRQAAGKRKLPSRRTCYEGKKGKKGKKGKGVHHAAKPARGRSTAQPKGAETPKRQGRAEWEERREG
jgi:hypothetical protein